MIDVYDKSTYEVKNAFDSKFCTEIIKMFEEDPRKAPGVLARGIDDYVKKSTDLYIDSDQNFIRNFYHEIMKIVKSKYLPHLCDNGVIRLQENETSDFGFMIANNNLKISNPIIQRTDKDGFFHWHSDMGMERDRLLAVIMYLNDVPEEHGGATEFNMGRKVQPEMGKVLLFPVSFWNVHRGAILKKGKKYIITAFIGFPDVKKVEPKQHLPFIIS